jgi:hypothetical protein
MAEGRWHEAISVFLGLYQHPLRNQDNAKVWTHKGLPLVYVSDCYYHLGCPVLAKRYLMLTTCEDAIQDKGFINPERGVYFRLVWRHGLSHREVERYGLEIFSLWQNQPDEAIFPEWILLSLDQDWMIEFQASREASLYVVTRAYIQRLLGGLDGGDGKRLELLGQYLLSAIPGCRAYRRKSSESTDYDIVCTLEGQDLDFRSDLGRYFICECKDWDSTADRGIVIVVLSEADLKQIADGFNLIAMLRNKYEFVRLDLKTMI